MKFYLGSELIVALVAVAAITAGYLCLAQSGVPRPNSLVGYALGITGFLMMLSTETLYSLRKRTTRFTLWPTSTWLQLHIVTGIVGPYLVLLHSGWKFAGLAGVLTLFTGVVVLSGLVGRYIYTGVPRNLDGSELAVGEIKERIAHLQLHLKKLGVECAVPAEPSRPAWLLVFGRALFRWGQERRLRVALATGPREVKMRQELHRLESERLRWELELRLLEAARRLLALWHVVHVPLSAALFTLAALHIGAALYYASFLR